MPKFKFKEGDRVYILHDMTPISNYGTVKFHNSTNGFYGVVPDGMVESLDFSSNELEITNKQMGGTGKVKATRISVVYELRNSKYNIAAVIETDGKISLFTGHNQKRKEFIFENSTPETVRAIGELLIKASEL